MARWQPSDGGGVVSYRLARQRTVDAFRDGRRTTHEICDAQPELRRVVHNHGAALGEVCPICDDADLVAVTFAFGHGLPKGGRLVADLEEMNRLRRRERTTTCYTLEVCPRCWWNHLRESFELDGRDDVASAR